MMDGADVTRGGEVIQEHERAAASVRVTSALVPKCPADTSALVPLHKTLRQFGTGAEVSLLAEKSKTFRYQRQSAELSWVRSVRTPAVRSVTLNLANKFSQCTFSIAEHYDLFSDLIILRQA